MLCLLAVLLHCRLELYAQSVYLSLVQAARKTTVYSLPTINLLKNSASELYLLQPASSYQLAFGYIRQLAVHLRNSMKATGKVRSQPIRLRPGKP